MIPNAPDAKPDDAAPPGAARDITFLDGNSEMAQLIRQRDWSASPLGPIEQWSSSLRTTVSLCLASNFPINIIWGEQHTQIYNDGYRVVCGDKHPAALGMDYTECWASAWPALSTPFARALSGETTFLENQRMFLFRNGYLEETFFTFSLSPIRDETGGIGGLFHPVTETTSTIVGERRTRTIRDLTVRLASAASRAELFSMAIETFAGFELDLPFVLLYQRMADAPDNYLLSGSCGIDAGSAAAPELLNAAQPSVWPLRDLLENGTVTQLDGLRATLDGAHCGPYDEAPDSAFVLPVYHPGDSVPVALLVAGASSRLPLDNNYRDFYHLLAAAFGAALSRVTMAEEERKRLDMLAAIDRAKNVFFSNVSHEFRTPLTLMLGPLEDALAGGKLPQEERDRLEIAQRNAQRLLKLVNSLLDFSRIEAGRNEASYEPVQLDELTADLASNFSSACARAGLALTVDCEPIAGPVWVDPDMWEQIVLNLLSNAFKFTLEGGIHISLRQQGDGVTLRVDDTGVGIPASHLATVFERFHRVEGQRGRSMEGTGIGLALVRELVHLHGGGIDVSSVENQGSSFSVHLKFGNLHLPQDQLRSAGGRSVGSGASTGHMEEMLRWLPAQDAPAGAPTPAGAARVLLADDNADMRDYVQRLLEQAGYHVTAVADGRAALAAIHAGPPPDLLLSDVMMPEMDGFALLAALRADAATRDLVVILLSARAGLEARLDALGAGADDYLIKPFGARELIARIDGAVNLARQRKASAERELALRIEIETEHSRNALLQSQAQFDSLFEQTAAGVAETDLNGRILRVNARFCQIVGRTREELIGHDKRPLIHPDDWETDAARTAAMLASGEPFEIDSRYVHADGSAVWVTKAVTPIRSPGNGQAASILGVVLDITGRKRVEQELRLNDARKDEFLAMLAHELRNPLAPISAAAELIARGRHDEALLARTSCVIIRQVHHMTALIDDLLDVSRVTRGLVSIEKDKVDLKYVVAVAVEQVRPLIEQHRHHLTIDLPAAQAWVLGDDKRLVQVLTNLLNNAAKYTPAGGNIDLLVEVDGGDVLLRVRDNGVGIAPELQPRIFDLFAQAERTPDRALGGLGLGLALVKTMVALHGGEVDCVSQGVGRGTTFIVRLPLHAEQVDAMAQQANGPASVAPRIMVVDDNVDAAEMLAMLMEAHGHSVSVEHEPHAALARAQREHPDVCVIDIGLPGMDGNELARRLRLHEGTSQSRLIALTGYSKESDRRTAMAAGFDNFFAKPADMTSLLALLEEQG